MSGVAVTTAQELRWQLMQRVMEREPIILEVMTPGSEIFARSLDISRFDASQLDADFTTPLGLLPYQPKLKPVIGAVARGSVAEAAGLLAGDEVRQINGQRIDHWGQLVALVKAAPGLANIGTQYPNRGVCVNCARCMKAPFSRVIIVDDQATRDQVIAWVIDKVPPGNGCSFGNAGGIASMAIAGTKSFIINGTDFFPSNGGAWQGAATTYDGMFLADPAFSAANINFILPSDYKKNTPVTIKLRTYGGSSCTIILSAAGVYRQRVGTDFTLEHVGLTNSGSDTFTRPASGSRSVERSFTLRKAGSGTLDSGSIRDQKAGDQITAFFMRNGGVDTCAVGIVLTSAKITYTTN